MAAASGSETLEERVKTANYTESPDLALQKCVAILHAAKTDNERFAALLLVTQLVQSNSIDSSGRRKLFDAVGFTFINRLLSTKAVPSDCPSTVFKSLAVTILACFATDEELIFHPQMTAKISFFLDVISNSGEDSSTVEYACQILSTFASSEVGCEHLLRRKSVKVCCEMLGNASASGNASSKLVFGILKKILHFCPQEAWEQHGETLIKLLVNISENFKKKQDFSKFELCENLNTLISTVDKSLFTRFLEVAQVGNDWQSNIKVGLGEILQSKVKPEQRNPALALTSTLSQLTGMEWMLGAYKDGSVLASQDADSFFILALSSASIEVRMVIDHTRQEEIAQKLLLMSVCYSILENAINFMSGCIATETVTAPLESTLSKGYSIVAEALKCVTRYLVKVSLNVEPSDMNESEQNFLYASVRLLCAWMAEETMALQQEIIQLLPFLLKLARESFKTKSQSETETSTGDDKKVKFDLPPDDVIRNMAELNLTQGKSSPDADQPRVITFLLPALCHLSADDKPRKVLIDKGAHVLLCEYFVFVYDKWVENKMDRLSESTLTLLIGIFLNFTVTEPELVGSNKVFVDLCKQIMCSLPDLTDKHQHVVLLANMVVLGLMLVHCQYDAQKEDTDQKPLVAFFEVAITFLRAATKLGNMPQLAELESACAKEWSEITELWLLGMEVTVSCVKAIKWLKDILIGNGWLGEIKGSLNDPTGTGKNLTPEAVEVLTKLVKETGEGKD